MFISTTSPLVLCMYKFVSSLFYLLLYLFLDGQGNVYFNKAHLCFRLVSTNGKSTEHPILTMVVLY